MTTFATPDPDKPAGVAGPVVRRIDRACFQNSPAHKTLSAFCSAMHDSGIDGADMRAAMLWLLGLEEIEEANAAPTQPEPLKEKESVKRLIGEMLDAYSIATAVCRDVAELPDRNSPQDWPIAMLVTADELHQIVREAVISAQKPGPTVGMNIAQRILHVGGRNNAAGYVEFGSIQAVEALVRQLLRDLQLTHVAQGDAVAAALSICDARAAGWDQAEIPRDDIYAQMQISAKNEARAIAAQIREYLMRNGKS